MLLFLFTFLQYLITRTTSGVHSFSLKPGKYIIECYGPQNKYEGTKKELALESKGEYISISISIEGKAQHFTAFLGNKHENSLENKESNEPADSTFIVLNSKNENRIIALAESGKLTKKIDSISLSNFVSYLNDSSAIIIPSSFEDNEHRDDEETIINENDYSIIKFSIIKRKTNQNEGDGKLYISSLYQCPSNCKKCHDNIICDECEDYFIFDSLNNECVLQCPRGMYSMNGECYYCPTTLNGSKEMLLQCSNNTQHRKVQCNEGFYSCGTLLMKCCDCPGECIDCAYQIGNGRTCTKCQANGHVSDKDCVANDGYYKSGSYFYQCSTNCKTCSAYSTCTSCDSPKYLSGTRCYCPSGTYESGRNCYSCYANCLTCSSYSYCTSCSSGKTLSEIGRAHV